MELQNLYQQLHSNNLCDSGLQFSQEYLGKYKSYYSVIKATNAQANTNTLVHLDFALQRKLDCLQEESKSLTQSQVFTVLDIKQKIKKEIEKRCLKAIHASA